MPIPDASMVRILVTPQPAKRRLNSLPISAKRATSIWWLRKLSTLRTLPALTWPVFEDALFQQFHSGFPPKFDTVRCQQFSASRADLFNGEREFYCPIRSSTRRKTS